MWKRNTLQKIPEETTETLRKLYVSTKFPHQEIIGNYNISCSDNSKATRFFKGIETENLLPSSDKKSFAFEKEHFYCATIEFVSLSCYAAIAEVWNSSFYLFNAKYAVKRLQVVSEAHSEPSQTSEMKLFAKTANG